MLKKVSLIVLSVLAIVQVSLADIIPPPLSAQEYFVPQIPDIVANVTQFAGHIPIRKNANIFFWLFENEKILTETKKLTIWLNGGPGCSSMDGVFMENGPFTFDEDDHIIPNPYSWNKYSNMLYVDQPVGTGYSFTLNNDIPSTEPIVGKDFRTFLEQFFKVFPQYEDSEIYIAGESFAGTYIPYIAKDLLNNDVNEKRINLKAIAIGNGWMDPLRQYEGYIQYSIDNNLLSGNYLSKAQAKVDQCKRLYSSSDTIKKYSCEYILDTILNASMEGGKQCINMYDIRLRDKDSTGGCGLYSWPLTLKAMTKYLGRADVIEALHVKATPHIWRECSSRVSSALSGDNSPPSYTLFPELLKQIKITLFVGDQDLICNHVGIELMIDNLNWGGISGFENNYVDWIVNGVVNGVYQTERNLTYIRITNGSHMVPIDLPEESLIMFNAFIGVNIQEERKSTLCTSDSCQKSTTDVTEVGEVSRSNMKILALASSSLGLICGIALITYSKFKKSSKSVFRTTEWHELNENEETSIEIVEDGTYKNENTSIDDE